MFKRLVISAMLFLLMCTGVYAQKQQYLVKFKDDCLPVGCGERVIHSGYENVYITYDKSVGEEFADYIEYIEPNGEIFLIEDVAEISAFSVPEDKYYPRQWQIQMIDAQSAWDIETYGNEINVAVIDSGASMHPDIAPNIAGGYNYVTNSTDFSDNNGHGTHVAGLIAAVHNQTGIPGVAPKANIYALKCIESDVGGDELTLARAIKGAVDDFNCRVINMSLGTKVNSTTIYEAVRYAHSKGVIIVAAVGNEKNQSLYYPAAYDEVIGIGSVDFTKEKSDFSQYNKSVFAVAPGRKSLSLHAEGGSYGYAERSGTSQASPLVAAAAAIMLSADSSMTDEKFRELIKSTSEDLGDTGYDIYYGWGLINIGRMLDELTKPYPCYMSPANDGSVLVYNKSENAVNTMAIAASYDNDSFESAQYLTAIIMPGQKIKLKTGSDAKESKLLLWDFNDNMTPLARDREMKY